MITKSSRQFDLYIKRLIYIPFIYLAFGILWIAATDWTMFSYTIDFQTISTISTYKGWLFIFITFIFIFILVKKVAFRLRDSNTQIAKLSLSDQLTGLPNRYVIIDRIERLIIASRRHDLDFGIIFIDIDDFKTINDTLGHVAGDTLLKEFGERLTSAVRQADTVSRFGGDEFLILLPSIADSIDLVISKIQAKLNADFLTQKNTGLVVNASMGAALFPRDGTKLEELLLHADHHMYKSKRNS